MAASCSSGTPDPRPVPLAGADNPEELRTVLESLEERSDPEAWIARARVYARLRRMEPAEEAAHLRRGDAADLQVLFGVGDSALKEEAAGRLAAHFRERAEGPELCSQTFAGPIGPSLRRYAMLTAAANFCEYASGGPCPESNSLLAKAAETLAGEATVDPSFRKVWKARALERSARAERPGANGGASPEVRRFCEDGPARHLEEAQRAADAGTREKAARGNPEKVADWYLRALAHYALAAECLCDPTAGQGHSLTGMEIVIRSLSDLMGRQQ